MINIFLGFLSGLSVGIFCLGLCLPIFLPVLLSQKRDIGSSWLVFLHFSLGRLLGYLLFGYLIGFLGKTIVNNQLHLIISLVNLWLGITMIFYSLGLIDNKFCTLLPFKKIKWPIVLGFLTGVNICPPFLASLTYVFNLKSISASLWYFLMFFLGTTVYLIPAVLLGWLTKFKWLNYVARISGIMAGIYFITINLL